MTAQGLPRRSTMNLCFRYDTSWTRSANRSLASVAAIDSLKGPLRALGMRNRGFGREMYGMSIDALSTNELLGIRDDSESETR